MSSNLTQAKSFAPPAPDSPDVLRYVDKDGVWHGLTSDGVDVVLSGRSRFNWLGNAGFWFAQRQAPAVATVYNSAALRVITADRWGVVNENASVTYQRTDTSAAPEVGLQSRYYANFTKTTAAGKFVVTQMLTGNETDEIRGRTVRFQVKLKNIGTSVTQTRNWNIGIVTLTGDGSINISPNPFVSAFSGAGVNPVLGTNVTYVAPRSDTVGENCSLSASGGLCATTSAWRRFGIVVDVPMDCQNVYVMIWPNNATGINNGVAIGEVALTLGPETQAWSPQTYASELIRIQRFYWKTFGIDTAPVQNAGVNTGELAGIAGKAGAVALAGQLYCILPTTMFPPGGQVIAYNPAAANALVRDIGAGVDCSANALLITIRRVRVTCTGNAATAIGNQLGVHLTVDSEII